MPSESSPRLTVVLFLVVINMVALSALLLLRARPEPAVITIHPPVPTATPLPTATALPTFTPAPILVYVTGAVHQPGTLHVLPSGSHVQDVIAAAGGIADLADKSRVNLAAILRDGDHIHVPLIHQDSDSAALPTASGGNLVYVNTAAADELETLPGIGPMMALRIVAYRDAVGPFKNLDDLDNVSGIGPGTLAKLRGLVAFD